MSRQLLATWNKSTSLLLIVVLLAACGGGGGGVDAAAGAEQLAVLPDAQLQLERGQLLDHQTEDPAPATPGAGDFSVSELSTRVPLVLRVASATDGMVRIGGTLVPTNRWHVVPVTRIAAGESITVEYRDAQHRSVVQRIHTRPQGLPAYTTRGRTSLPGDILLTASGQFIQPYLLLLDGSGALVYYQRSPDLAFSNFNKHHVGGQVFYSYMQGRRELPIGYLEGKTTVMDAAFRVVRVIDGLLPNAAVGRPPIATENHDFLLLGEDHYLVSGYYGSEVDGIPGAPPGTRLVSSVLQEVRNGVVVFEWRSTDHPSLYAESEESNSYGTTTWSDYVHFNSIMVDPRDGHFVASFRNLNAILKIDRNDGRIVWRYGGRADDFGLTPFQWPQAQHHAQILADGTLLYFDNNTTCMGVGPALPRFHTPDPAYGNQTACAQRGPYSRVVKARLDESTRRVLVFDSWQFANDTLARQASGGDFQASRARSSVQQLPHGNLFVGFGANRSGERDILEWNPDTGAVVFELYFDAGGQPATQSDVGSYRALFVP